MDSATPEASRTPAPLKGLRRSLAQAPYSWSLPVVSALFAPSSIMRVGCDSGRDDVSRRCLLPRSTGLSKIGVWSLGSLLRSTRPSSSFVPRRFRPTPPRWRPGRPLCRSLRRLLSTGMILGPTPPRVNRPPRNPLRFPEWPSANLLPIRCLGLRLGFGSLSTGGWSRRLLRPSPGRFPIWRLVHDRKLSSLENRGRTGSGNRLSIFVREREPSREGNGGRSNVATIGDVE